MAVTYYFEICYHNDIEDGYVVDLVDRDGVAYANVPCNKNFNVGPVIDWQRVRVAITPKSGAAEYGLRLPQIGNIPINGLGFQITTARIVVSDSTLPDVYLDLSASGFIAPQYNTGITVPPETWVPLDTDDYGGGTKSRIQIPLVSFADWLVGYKEGYNPGDRVRDEYGTAGQWWTRWGRLSSRPIGNQSYADYYTQTWLYTASELATISHGLFRAGGGSEVASSHLSLGWQDLNPLEDNITFALFTKSGAVHTIVTGSDVFWNPLVDKSKEITLDPNDIAAGTYYQGLSLDGGVTWQYDDNTDHKWVVAAGTIVTFAWNGAVNGFGTNWWMCNYAVTYAASDVKRIDIALYNLTDDTVVPSSILSWAAGEAVSIKEVVIDLNEIIDGKEYCVAVRTDGTESNVASIDYACLYLKINPISAFTSWQRVTRGIAEDYAGFENPWGSAYSRVTDGSPPCVAGVSRLLYRAVTGARVYYEVHCKIGADTSVYHLDAYSYQALWNDGTNDSGGGSGDIVTESKNLWVDADWVSPYQNRMRRSADLSGVLVDGNRYIDIQPDDETYLYPSNGYIVMVVTGTPPEEEVLTGTRMIEYFMPQELFHQIEDAFFVHCGLTWDGGDPVEITGITNANPAIVTAPGHEFEDGDMVRISDVLGMTEVNNTDETSAYLVAGVLGDTFQLSGVDSSTWGIFAGGSTVEKVTNHVIGLITDIYYAGRTVRALGDGTYEYNGDLTVDGEATFPWYANKIHIGLPYSTIIEPMNPNAGSQQGTARTKKQKINRAGLCFYETVHCKVGINETLAYELPAIDSDAAATGVPHFVNGVMLTDDLIVDLKGEWEDKGTIYIEHDHATPFTLKAVIPRLNVDDES